MSELHTAEQWRVQLGRQVLADQVERPVKTVPKRGYKPDAMDLEVRCDVRARRFLLGGFAMWLHNAAHDRVGKRGPAVFVGSDKQCK